MSTDRVERHAAPSLWLPCRTLWSREIVRFLRQRSRVLGAMGTPPVFWILAGSGLNRSFVPAGAKASMSYLQYSFPGVLAAILMFTAVFSTISVIDDRREGFLQSVLVAPGSRASIVLGKVLGATTLAVGQALIFLLLAPLMGIPLGIRSFPATFAAMTLISFSLTSLGFWIAWRMESTQGFHAIMNLVLMPMLFLSGAFFPAAGAAKWLAWVMLFNPMTHGVSLMRTAMYLDGGGGPVAEGIGWLPALGISVGFAVLMFVASIRAVTRESARVLQ
ncbi:MAG: ABC transporter permease [Phycisphaerae bacterium]